MQATSAAAAPSSARSAAVADARSRGADAPKPSGIAPNPEAQGGSAAVAGGAQKDRTRPRSRGGKAKPAASSTENAALPAAAAASPGRSRAPEKQRATPPSPARPAQQQPPPPVQQQPPPPVPPQARGGGDGHRGGRQTSAPRPQQPSRAREAPPPAVLAATGGGGGSGTKAGGSSGGGGCGPRAPPAPPAAQLRGGGGGAPPADTAAQQRQKRERGGRRARNQRRDRKDGAAAGEEAADDAAASGDDSPNGLGGGGSGRDSFGSDAGPAAAATRAAAASAAPSPPAQGAVPAFAASSVPETPVAAAPGDAGAAAGSEGLPQWLVKLCGSGSDGGDKDGGGSAGGGGSGAAFPGPAAPLPAPAASASAATTAAAPAAGPPRTPSRSSARGWSGENSGDKLKGDSLAVDVEAIATGAAAAAAIAESESGGGGDSPMISRLAGLRLGLAMDAGGGGPGPGGGGEGGSRADPSGGRWRSLEIPELVMSSQRDVGAAGGGGGGGSGGGGGGGGGAANNGATAMPAAAGVPLFGSAASRWRVFVAPDGRKYYSDGQTSQWQEPDELARERVLEMIGVKVGGSGGTAGGGGGSSSGAAGAPPGWNWLQQQQQQQQQAFMQQKAVMQQQASMLQQPQQQQQQQQAPMGQQQRMPMEQQPGPGYLQGHDPPPGGSGGRFQRPPPLAGSGAPPQSSGLFGEGSGDVQLARERQQGAAGGGEMGRETGGGHLGLFPPGFGGANASLGPSRAQGPPGGDGHVYPVPGIKGGGSAAAAIAAAAAAGDDRPMDARGAGHRTGPGPGGKPWSLPPPHTHSGDFAGAGSASAGGGGGGRDGGNLFARSPASTLHHRNWALGGPEAGGLFPQQQPHQNQQQQQGDGSDGGRFDWNSGGSGGDRGLGGELGGPQRAENDAAARGAGLLRGGEADAGCRLLAMLRAPMPPQQQQQMPLDQRMHFMPPPQQQQQQQQQWQQGPGQGQAGPSPPLGPPMGQPPLLAPPPGVALQQLQLQEQQRQRHEQHMRWQQQQHQQQQHHMQQQHPHHLQHQQQRPQWQEPLQLQSESSFPSLNEAHRRFQEQPAAARHPGRQHPHLDDVAGGGGGMGGSGGGSAGGSGGQKLFDSPRMGPQASPNIGSPGAVGMDGEAAGADAAGEDTRFGRGRPKPKRSSRNLVGTAFVHNLQEPPMGPGPLPVPPVWGTQDPPLRRVRAKAHMVLRWELPAEMVVRRRHALVAGLFRYGVSSNKSGIISKRLFDNARPPQPGDPPPMLPPPGARAEGAVMFFAPKSVGTFVFRLYDEEEPVETHAASPPWVVDAQGRDVEASMRFVSGTLRAADGRGAMGALAQLTHVLTHLELGLLQRGARSAAAALWGAVAAARRLLDAVDEPARGGTDPGVDGRRSRAAHSAVCGVLSAALTGPTARHLLEMAPAQAPPPGWPGIGNAGSNGGAMVTISAVALARHWASLFCPFDERYFPTADALLAHFRADCGFVPRDLPLARVAAGTANALTRQAQQLLPTLLPGEGFGKAREEVRQRLEKLLVEGVAALPPSTQLRIFGSSANGFGSDASDLDMCLVVPEQLSAPPPQQQQQQPPPPGLASVGPSGGGGGGSSGGASGEAVGEAASPAELIEEVAEKLGAAGMQDVDCRATARIPIVLFVDPESGLECDISVLNPLAIRNTALLRTYAAVDPRVQAMAFLIKHWARRRAVNNASEGTLSSYGYLLCLLHFLQTRSPPIVPNLQALPPDWMGQALPVPTAPSPLLPRVVTRHPLDGKDYNTYFYQPQTLEPFRSFSTRNTESVGQLLAAFFRYFAWEFDYRRHAVSLRAGGVVDKEAKAETDCWQVHTRLSVEDPFETWYDVAHVLKWSRHRHVRLEFARAYTLLCDAAEAVEAAAFGSGGGADGAAAVPLEELLAKICEQAPPPPFLHTEDGEGGAAGGDGHGEEEEGDLVEDLAA